MKLTVLKHQLILRDPCTLYKTMTMPNINCVIKIATTMKLTVLKHQLLLRAPRTLYKTLDHAKHQLCHYDINNNVTG